MTQTDFRILIHVALACLCFGPAAMAESDLEILDGNYPISFYFRQTESTASLGRMSYSDWQERFSQLNGVMGKMLDEEVIGRSRGQSFFRRFKQQYPRQAVLLHANGGFRKPIAEIKLWQFNMATTCPRDPDGRQAADVWAGELIRAMSPGGEIDFVDGFQFDAPFIRPVSIMA
jgi:hypothetical protein